ncbi:hypothetical protein LWF15_33095 [Kineosporia rhizophila]|uniref:hypothetical protein n=1 Tax=Kineosporia rhizophila TaxID=84633 RepID=UPI001E357CBE|nr:hypothetical protein [Kineosporia rhizophila]MCE0540341.1 hypothetical protein [Kineosporia rhizophila]
MPRPEVALGGGRLLVSQSQTPGGRVTVVARDLQQITASGSVKVGTARQISAVEPIMLDEQPPSSGQVEVSGDYVLTADSQNGFMLRVGDRPAINLAPADPELTRIRQSGRYSLAGGVVYRPAPGNQVREVFRTSTDSTDLFGSKVSWVTASGQVKTLELNPGYGIRPAPKPEVLAARGGAGPIAVSAHVTAWLDTNNVVHLSEGYGSKDRLIRGTRATELQLDGGLLSWANVRGEVGLLDISDPDAKPRRSVLQAPYAVDNGLIAGMDQTGKVRVRALPFLPSRPLLISSDVKPFFSKGTIWRPQFDFAGPVLNAKLRITGGRQVRVIRGRAPHGSLNGLRWNGTGSNGKYLGPGCYHWTLAGTVSTVRGARPFKLGAYVSTDVEGGESGGCGGSS